ncbi:glutamine synthetase [Clostridia bacterium]|nr:glutamine synthetase [Clostridia bacterium]
MSLTTTYGCMVFNDEVMRARLPKDIYKALHRTIVTGQHFNLDVANVVAAAMKSWAVELGATHFTHWFQPMTGVTAEKHDSFINPSEGGGVILEFSGKELVRGEPDASSFPSGGLRATFEARGYTAWDPTSYAFVKDNTLYIPTAFCSYDGQALDMKTPLLRSMDAIDKQAKRILKLFGQDVMRVNTTVGAEQEYFLIDAQKYHARPDLIHCGRTLFGARPPKGQELDDHYFGALKPRVLAYMAELDAELWKIGVPAKTKHNEVAPAQHELAPVFEISNVAVDHNQVTMELMKSVALKHGLVCLLSEKPFAGVNGSGKHNNWSISTDKGDNLLEPGKTPSHNARFLLFLAAVVKAVDEYQDLLRLSVASAGNDHRLGANEAPPAIVSMFVGDELAAILEALEKGDLYVEKEKKQMSIGATVLPHFPSDNTDRNRTSPFAFTGNKFEFRMPGSSQSIAMPNIVLNTIVAEQLKQFADLLEGTADFETALHNLVVDVIKKHKRIIFNGNNYAAEWTVEAEKRGLSNRKTTVDSLPALIAANSVALFEEHGVFSKSELFSRHEVLLENYCKTLHIEALTMLDMTRRGVIPSVLSYEKELIKVYNGKKSAGTGWSVALEDKLVSELSELSALLLKKLEALDAAVLKVKDITDLEQQAKTYRDEVFTVMTSLRGVADQLETLTGADFWAYPSYANILYSVY